MGSSVVSYLSTYTPNTYRTDNSQDANLCEDSHWEDHHLGGGAKRFYRECEGQDPGQGGHSPRSAEAHLRWQAAGGWQDPLRLQHPEGVHSSPGASSAWWSHRALSQASCPEVQL